MNCPRTHVHLSHQSHVTQLATEHKLPVNIPVMIFRQGSNYRFDYGTWLFYKTFPKSKEVYNLCKY